MSRPTRPTEADLAGMQVLYGAAPTRAEWPTDAPPWAPTPTPTAPGPTIPTPRPGFPDADDLRPGASVPETFGLDVQAATDRREDGECAHRLMLRAIDAFRAGDDDLATLLREAARRLRRGNALGAMRRLAAIDDELQSADELSEEPDDG